jgi:hypothetical protein
VDTLENILDKAELKKRINFIKMDIEGFETEVLSQSIDIIKNADTNSIELHNTKRRKWIEYYQNTISILSGFQRELLLPAFQEPYSTPKTYI